MTCETTTETELEERISTGLSAIARCGGLSGLATWSSLQQAGQGNAVNSHLTDIRNRS
jgi:uncharacterized protein YidB (DUF937 family)